MPTLIHQRVRDCQLGKNLKTIARVRSGWVVLGDVQFVSGYSLLLPDPVVPHFNALDAKARAVFSEDLLLLGDVLLEVTGAARINYEILGNLEPALHAHAFPRFDDEVEELKTKPVWFYDWDAAPKFDVKLHGEIIRRIESGLSAIKWGESNVAE